MPFPFVVTLVAKWPLDESNPFKLSSPYNNIIMKGHDVTSFRRLIFHTIPKAPKPRGIAPSAYSDTPN